MCRGKPLHSCTSARKVHKSPMSEGFKKPQWTWPLCCFLSMILYILFMIPNAEEVSGEEE